MPRPPLTLETWGKIRRATVAGKPTAFAYYRNAAGKVIEMRRIGKTEAAAETNLKEALRGALKQAAGGDLLSPESTVNQLGDAWLAELTLKNTVAGTFNTYRSSLNSKIRPGFGDIRLREATVPRVDRFIKGLMVTPTAARTARTVLLQMFALAVRQGAAASNPVISTMAITPQKKIVKVIALGDIHAMRKLFAAYDETRTSELVELSQLLMATGCRIGEALAIRWEDIDIDQGLLRITGTLATDTAGKLFRQEHPKSDASTRGLMLPPTVLQALTQRRINSHYAMVFPSSTGTYRWTANSRRQWRQAIAESVYVGKTPRDFRKAVATHLNTVLGVAAAQTQLGHGSSEITTTYYLEAQETVADFAGVIETMFQNTD